MIEQLLRRAHATAGATDTVPMFMVSGGQTVPVAVTWEGADSAVVTIGAAAIHARVGAGGSLLGATIPAQHVEVVREEGAHPLAVPKIDYGPPAGAPYTAQDVTVHTPGDWPSRGRSRFLRRAAGPFPPW